ncbi:MAG: lectin [Betaproteobacteria bacterium]|nr:MAG: lectin [Betaproteobacteria bacterium]
MKTVTRLSLAAAVALAVGSCGGMQSQQSGMSFFVTSAGSAKGADLGGLEGADRHCQSLAKAAGSGGRNWRAYLSASASGGYPPVNARDRIGRGPWQNAKGVVIASNVDQLHGANNLTKETALNERGGMVNGRTEKPNMHDMLTGSTRDGRAITGGEDTTCSNWTTSGAGAAMLGHHDRQGLRDDDASKSWNSSHLSRPSKEGAPGCSQAALQGTGGNGLFYCFAAN